MFLVHWSDRKAPVTCNRAVAAMLFGLTWLVLSEPPMAIAQSPEQPTGAVEPTTVPDFEIPKQISVPDRTKERVRRLGDSEVLGQTTDPDRTAELFQQLGAREFAIRERAASELIELGVSRIPQLRELVEQTDDPEIQMRATEIIRQLSDGDLAGRITDFLAGATGDFPGWRLTSALLGDNQAIRELFVQLMQEHPDILASLELTTRDRVMALEKTVAAIENKIFKEFQFPNQADTFALLIPVVDQQLPTDDRLEPMILNVLNKEAASKIKRDAQLSVPFKSLLTRWMIRSKQENREEILRVAMEWDLGVGLPIATQTLQEEHSPETLSAAFQSIARFGNRDQIVDLVPFLDDTRSVVGQGFVRGKEVQTLLGDAAMAAIAQLAGVPLTELGMPESAKHSKFAFLVTEVGFPSSDPLPRKSARTKVDRLVAQALGVDSTQAGKSTKRIEAPNNTPPRR